MSCQQKEISIVVMISVEEVSETQRGFALIKITKCDKHEPYYGT